jgi:hypothetical protein
MQSQCAWGPECSLIASFYLTTTWDEMSRNKQHEAIETGRQSLVLTVPSTVATGTSKSWSCCGELILFPGYQLHVRYRAAEHGSRTNDSVLVTCGG